MKKFLLFFLLLSVASCQTGNRVSPELTAKKQELNKLADNAKTSGDFNAAAQLEAQIISLDVNDPDSFINLSKTLKKQGFKAKSLELLQTGEKLNPTNEKLQLEVAKALLENSQPQPALEKLKTIKTIRDNGYYNSLGVAYDMNRDHQTAQETFKQGLKSFPDDGLMQNNLGLSYILDGKYEQAIKILEPLANGPDSKPKYRQNLALAYGIMAKSQEAYSQLIKDLPKDQANENLKFYKNLRSK